MPLDPRSETGPFTSENVFYVGDKECLGAFNYSEVLAWSAVFRFQGLSLGTIYKPVFDFFTVIPSGVKKSIAH
jgi:hypothetical protein